MLFFANETFAKAEETKLQKAKFLAKEKEKFTPNIPIKFNRGYIKQKKDLIALTQECQCQNLKLVIMKAVDLTSFRGEVCKAVTLKDQYIAQRAKGAYIIIIC